MTARGSAALYTPEILALAVELARFPTDETQPLRGEAHSRVCGSRITLTLTANEEGRIAAAGARVSACAIGQAAAALFLKSVSGRSIAGITAAHNEIESWLAGGDAIPSWPSMAMLSCARVFPARHPAILLPWKAALAALSKSAAAD